MSGDVQILGEGRLLMALDRIKESLPRQTAAALYQVGEEIMTLAKEKYVPVDLGALRASGYVEQRQEKDAFIVELGFGGPSAPYALIQHENMQYNHTTGGPKYLERPVMERANSIPRDVASKVHIT